MLTMTDYKSFSLDNEKINKASKVTIFFLIDLRAVFIITYVYITVVNLISATANSEATRDSKSNATFDITSRHDHQAVEVSLIDNAVLWNCREHSVTKGYYKTLYWMLFGTSATILFILLLVKLTVVGAAKHGYNYMWQLATLQYFHEELDNAKLHAERDARCYAMLLTKEIKTEVPATANHLRKFFLRYSVFLLPLLLLLTGLSYDSHPLSCMVGPSEETIMYNSSTNRVELRYSDNILRFQQVMAIFVIYLALLFIGCVIGFFCCNYWIIKKFKKQVELKKLEYYYEILETETETNEPDIKELKIQNLVQRENLTQAQITTYKKKIVRLPRQNHELLRKTIEGLENKVKDMNSELRRLRIQP